MTQTSRVIVRLTDAPSRVSESRRNGRHPSTTSSAPTLRKASIAERGVNEGSTMPPGLVDTLTLHELASLLAFLESTTAK